MKEYKRLTKSGGYSDKLDLKQELGYSYIYQRLSELEDMIESGHLVQTEKYELKYYKSVDLWCIYSIENLKRSVFDTHSKQEAENKLKELKGE